MKKIIWGIIAVFIVAAVFAGWFWQDELLGLIGKTAPFSTPSPTPVPSFLPSSWSIYRNDVYKYEISYPEGAAVSEAKEDVFFLSEENREKGVTSESLFEQYTGKICVSLFFKRGYIYISAPANLGFTLAQCGRTSAAYEQERKTEKLTIDGKEYLVSGFEEKGPGETLNFHNETMVVILDDGTRLEYGSYPSEKYTFADYLAMRNEILQIIQSFQKIK